jgi:hypothetical protein
MVARNLGDLRIQELLLRVSVREEDGVQELEDQLAAGGSLGLGQTGKKLACRRAQILDVLGQLAVLLVEFLRGPAHRSIAPLERTAHLGEAARPIGVVRLEGDQGRARRERFQEAGRDPSVEATDDVGIFPGGVAVRAVAQAARHAVAT